MNYLILFFCLTAQETFCAINNFFFDINNPQYGKLLPQRIIIPGTYKIDTALTPDYNLFPKSLLNDPTFDINVFRGKNKEAPWVCLDNVAQIISSVTQNSYQVLQQQLNELNSSNTLTVSELKNLIYTGDITLKPFIDVFNPDFNCISMDKNLELSTDGHSYTFNYDATFTNFQPIIFVDYFGLNAFMYKQKMDTINTQDSSGLGIRYCAGYAYVGNMVTLGPRPQCMGEVPDTHRIIESGVITIYKPNIITIRREIHECTMILYQWVTADGAYMSVNQEAGATTSEQIKAEDCRTWVTSKFADFSKYVGEKDWGRDGQWYINAHRDKTCTKNLEAAVIDYTNSKQLTNENQPGLYNWYTKLCKDATTTESGNSGNSFIDLFRPHYKSDRFGKLSRGYIDMLMPHNKMMTPWTVIPQSRLFDDHHEENFRAYVWDAFTEHQVCKYIQRFISRVDVVKYLPGTMDLEYDFSNGAEYVKYFISDSTKTMFIVDSKQRINGLSSALCISSTEKDELYMTKDGEIIKFTKDEKLTPAGKTIRYYSDSYDAINVDTKGNVVNVQSYASNIKSSQQGDMDTLFSGLMLNPPVRAPDTNRDQNARITNFTDDKDVEKKEQMLIQQITTFKDAVRYEFETIRLRENKNLHIRATKQCKQAQFDYDTAIVLSQLTPNSFWTNMLKESIEATYGGNGFFNVRPCESVRNIRVIPTLNTISTLKVEINSNVTTFDKIISSLYTLPSIGKCLTMPLVIFQLMTEPKELIGQLSLEGIIDITRISLLEECDYGKNYAFRIQEMMYLFSNYELVGKIPAEYIFNKTFRSMPNPTINGEKIPKEVMDVVLKLTPVDVIKTDLKEKAMASIPTGIFSMSDIYTLAEKQSIYMGLANVIEGMARDSLYDAIYEYTLPIGGGGLWRGKDADTAAKAFGRGVAYVLKKSGTAGYDLLKKGAEVLKDAANDLGGGLRNLVDNGNNLLKSILLPITIICSILGAIIFCFFAYKIYQNYEVNKQIHDEDEQQLMNEDPYYNTGDGNENVLFDQSQIKPVETEKTPETNQTSESNQNTPNQNYYS